MQSELKPCPSCGPDGHIELHGSIARGGRFVRCEICGFQGPSNCNQREAITAWNTRASDAEITRLRAALRQIQDEGDVHSNVIATKTLEGSDAE